MLAIRITVAVIVIYFILRYAVKNNCFSRLKHNSSSDEVHDSMNKAESVKSPIVHTKVDIRRISESTHKGESVQTESRPQPPKDKKVVSLSSQTNTKKGLRSGEFPFYISCDTSASNKYIFLATLDLNTCPKCAKRDLTGFSGPSRMPPCHPGCRCTTMPGMFPSELRRINRFARNPITGKGTSVPGDMNYLEWHRIYVENDPLAQENERKIRENPDCYPYQETQILFAIRSSPGILQSKLADSCNGISKASATQCLKRLVATGQIYKIKHGNTFALFDKDYLNTK